MPAPSFGLPRFVKQTINKSTDLQIYWQEIETPTCDEVRTSTKRSKAAWRRQCLGLTDKSSWTRTLTHSDKIIMKVWDNERIPDDWLLVLMMPVHKKGTGTECKNYEGICLFDTSYTKYWRLHFVIDFGCWTPPSPLERVTLFVNSPLVYIVV